MSHGRLDRPPMDHSFPRSGEENALSAAWGPQLSPHAANAVALEAVVSRACRAGPRGPCRGTRALERWPRPSGRGSSGGAERCWKKGCTSGRPVAVGLGSASHGHVSGVLTGEGTPQRAFQRGRGMQARCSGCEDTSWNLASVGEAPDLQDTHIRRKAATRPAAWAACAHALVHWLGPPLLPEPRARSPQAPSRCFCYGEIAKSVTFCLMS